MLMLESMALGIWHVGLSMHYIDTWLLFCFHEYCLLVVIISRICNVTGILYFCGAISGSTLFPFAIPCINGATYQGDSTSSAWIYTSRLLVALCFNPWYANFMSSLSSCENQPPCSWLIASSFHYFGQRIISGLIGNLLFCGLKYSAGLFCYVSWPSFQLW